MMVVRSVGKSGRDIAHLLTAVQQYWLVGLMKSSIDRLGFRESWNYVRQYFSTVISFEARQAFALRRRTKEALCKTFCETCWMPGRCVYLSCLCFLDPCTVQYHPWWYYSWDEPRARG